MGAKMPGYFTRTDPSCGEYKLFQEWVKENKIKKRYTVYNWHCLIWENLSIQRRDYLRDDPPLRDHECCYSDENGKRFYCYFPYNKPDEKIMKEWCEKRGLSFKIHSPEFSWYSKDCTYFIELQVSDIAKTQKFIKEERKTKKHV